MTLTELITAWRVGAKIEYRTGAYVRTLPPYDETKLDALTELFYRQGVKFRVVK